MIVATEMLLLTTAVVVIMLVVPPSAEAFSVLSAAGVDCSTIRGSKLRTSYTYTSSTFAASPPVTTPYPLQQRKSTSSLVTSYGSLRDLLSNDDNNDDGDEADSNRSINADDREFGLSQRRRRSSSSRSKFASDTGFRSRSVYGTGSDEEDERGLHADRLSTFSFASNQQRSGSQGSLSDDDGDLLNEEILSGGPEDFTVEESPIPSADKSGFDYDNNDMIVDNFKGMAGINYSKNKVFPSREKDIVSDEVDERGLHSDRLSTFSFSSNQQPSGLGPSRVQKSAQQILVEDSDNNSSPPARSFGVDNFHNNINVSMRKDSSPANRDIDPIPDGLDNHFDRLSTYSKGRTDDTIPSTEGRVSVGSGGVDPFDKLNHDDRLGTFSFASTDPHSGSTTIKGTSASSPLPNTPNESIKPPQRKVSTNKEEEQVSTTNYSKSEQFDKIDSVYSFGKREKGSLSSLASSVSVKSRSDRIKDIKFATDPRRLHPDGQDIPRLNSKGDVMSFSRSGGRLSIFERIDLVNEEGEEGKDDEGDVGSGGKEEDVYSVDDSDYDGGKLILEKKSTDDNSGE